MQVSPHAAPHTNPSGGSISEGSAKNVQELKEEQNKPEADSSSTSPKHCRINVEEESGWSRIWKGIFSTNCVLRSKSSPESAAQPESAVR